MQLTTLFVLILSQAYQTKSGTQCVCLCAGLVRNQWGHSACCASPWQGHAPQGALRHQCSAASSGGAAGVCATRVCCKTLQPVSVCNIT